MSEPHRLSRFRRRVANAVRTTAAFPDKRRALPRWAMFELLRGATPLAAVERDGIRYLVRTEDRGVSRVTYMSGDYDLDVMHDALEWLERVTGRDALSGRVFVDVGANIGTSSIPAVRRFAASRAIAFEPAEDNFRVLSANLALNGLAGRVDAHRMGSPTRPARASSSWRRATRGTIGFARPRLPARSTPTTRTAARPSRSSSCASTTHSTGWGSKPMKWGCCGSIRKATRATFSRARRGLLQSRVPTVCEYWPYGLHRAGGLDRFHSIVAESFSQVVDARADDVLPAARVGDLAERYPGERYTDLLLVP